MIDNIVAVIGCVGTLTGLIASMYLSRRAKTADVKRQEAEAIIVEIEARSKEINTADQMIEIVKKAYAEEAEVSRKDREKLRRSITKLEKAVRSIGTCPHRAECPINEQLQADTDSTE